MQTELYFKTFASCIPVKGVSRSIICDLSRNSLDYIPNALYHILTEDKQLPLVEILDKYGEDAKETIEEYIQYLLDKEYIFLCTKEELSCFPDLSMEWDSALDVNNAILDLTASNANHLETICSQLNDLACAALQIRTFKNWESSWIKQILEQTEESCVKNIELVLCWQEQELQTIIDLGEGYPKLYNIYVHQAPVNKIEEYHSFRVIYQEEAIVDHSFCGNIHPSFFAVNIPTFTESQHHNSCLNRKISIDVNGYIKNCPSMQQSFGHISETSLEEVVKNPAFTKLWNIKKDEIEKCKGCEFRHICTDCRAYLEEPENLYSAPLKCGYNPETCEWEEWSSNPLKEKAIAHYQLQPYVLEN
jgi:SPASM domain peptide maturase of grasp-with-spasm system